MRSDFGVHFKDFFRRFAMDQRDIFFRGLLRTEQVGERDEGRLVFGEQNHAARLIFWSVRVVQVIQIALARPRFFVRDCSVEQFHQVRAVRFEGVGRSQNSGGLVQRK